MVRAGKGCLISVAIGAALLSLLCSSAGFAAESSPPPPMEWTAHWIWPSAKAIPEHHNQFIQFRKTFRLEKVPKKADLAIFADSRYQLFLNGELIGRGPARSPDYWAYYDVFDVASKLHLGLNTLAVEVRWFGGALAWYRPYPGGWNHGSLVCQLEIGQGKDKKVIQSDATWKSTEDHAWEPKTPQVDDCCLAPMEVYHASRSIPGWTKGHFDDSHWVSAEVIKSAWGLTSPPSAPFSHIARRPLAYPVEREMVPAKVVEAGVTREENTSGTTQDGLVSLVQMGKHFHFEPHQIRPSVIEHGGNLTSDSSTAYAVVRPALDGGSPYLILDMGREVDGYPQIALNTPSSTVVDIGWSEMLVDGHITADEPPGTPSRYAARYYARPGQQNWTLWGWHGLRFIELEFPHLKEPVRVRASFLFSTARLQHRGSFSSSSSLLTKLWHMGAYTWQLCTLDGTMDCPTREQHEWVGDGEIELLVNSVADGTLDIARKFLLDAAHNQRPDGAIPAISADGDTESLVIDDYIFSFVNALHEYYVETGDRDFVLRLYPNVVRAMMWFQPLRQPDGLLGKMPDWVFLDWSNPDKAGESSILNALYVHTLENAAQMADMAGDAFHGRIFRSDVARIRAIFNERFWNESRGLYVDAWDQGKQSEHVSQLANADAILYGFAPAKRIPGMVEKMVNPATLRQQVLDPTTMKFVTEGRPLDLRHDVIQAQPYGMFFFLSALSEQGDAQAVRKFIENLWGPMAAAGNDTFWEQFVQRNGTSCHAWSAAPTYILSRLVLGIQPLEPGYRSYIVAPHPAGLAWAKGGVPTVRGAISVDWKWEQGASRNSASSAHGERFVLRLHNPAAAAVHVTLPKRNGRLPSAVWLNGKMHTGKVEINQPGDYLIEGEYY
ncbi:MAG TPA: alpha-L-rhamnosidase N-terminal domain-containing protein [Terriglobia bacterium]|nr:alpha-L-rhamnosidase N-terminal domain-containing protein [Terriglobia bacterium]